MAKHGQAYKMAIAPAEPRVNPAGATADGSRFQHAGPLTPTEEGKETDKVREFLMSVFLPYKKTDMKISADYMMFSFAVCFFYTNFGFLIYYGVATYVESIV